MMNYYSFQTGQHINPEEKTSPINNWTKIPSPATDDIFLVKNASVGLVGDKQAASTRQLQNKRLIKNS